MNKTGGYEAHMTFPRDSREAVEGYGKEKGWVFSVITGCPLLGQGTYCYLTNYSKDTPETLVSDMEEIRNVLGKQGVETLRAKVERIVYDTKTGVNEIGSR